MNPTRKLVLAAVAVCLFVLVLVVATAGLMLASEAGESGGGRTPEERVVALVVVALAGAALGCWALIRLHALYVAAPLRMAEELAATVAYNGCLLYTSRWV